MRTLECHGMAHLVMLRVYRLVLVQPKFFANTFTRRHPSETLNENAKHDHCVPGEVLHTAFIILTSNLEEFEAN